MVLGVPIWVEVVAGPLIRDPRVETFVGRELRTVAVAGRAVAIHDVLHAVRVKEAEGVRQLVGNGLGANQVSRRARAGVTLTLVAV